MLIVLGGFLGSGRKALARELARTHDLYLYDIDSRKSHMLSHTKAGVKEITVQPRTDRQRLTLYQNVLRDLPMPAKMHPEMVIEDSFHRAATRTCFLMNVANYFDRVVFVWIDADEQNAERRLRAMADAGSIPSFEEGLRRRMYASSRFDGLREGTPRFHCVRAKTGVEALWELVKTASSVR